MSEWDGLLGDSKPVTFNWNKPSGLAAYSAYGGVSGGSWGGTSYAPKNGEYGSNYPGYTVPDNWYIKAPDNSARLFGLGKNTWSNIGTMGNLALGGLAAYTNWQQLGLAKKAFKFNKDMKQKEYAMAKDAYDRNVARAKSIGDQMRAGKVASV